MAKRMGMQKLKRRFAGHGPAALPLPAAVAEEVPMPILAEIDVVTESGTYPAADHVASDAAHEVTLVVYGWQNVQPGTGQPL